MAKEINSSTYLMIILTSLNYSMPKKDLGFNCLDTQTCCYGTLWTLTFFFLLSIFLDFIFLFLWNSHIISQLWDLLVSEIIGHCVWWLPQHLLCACTSRVITNHTPIGEYRLRFFSRKEFKCPCSLYPIESHRHILQNCRRFNGYWNPRWDSLSHFVIFLEANSNAFAFLDNPCSTSISRSCS